MNMNDNTILRIKVPAHLYEAVKAQLTLNEAKKAEKYGAGMTPVGKKAAGASSDKPAATKNANASVKVTPYNAVKADEETSKMGAGVSEAKKLGLEELKSLAELLNNEIMKLEEKEKGAEKKAPVEEKKEADHEQEGQE